MKEKYKKAFDDILAPDDLYSRVLMKKKHRTMKRRRITCFSAAACACLLCVFVFLRLDITIQPQKEQTTSSGNASDAEQFYIFNNSAVHFNQGEILVLALPLPIEEDGLDGIYLYRYESNQKTLLSRTVADIEYNITVSGNYGVFAIYDNGEVKDLSSYISIWGSGSEGIKNLKD